MRLYFIFLIFLSFLNSAYSNDTKNSGRLVLAADDWCPFTCTETNSQGLGIVPDIVKEALSGSSFEMKYKMMNWARSIEMAKQNDIQGILGAYKSDVPQFLFSNKPQVISRDCIYGLSHKKLNYTVLKSLKDKKVGIVNGYSYGEEVDQFKASEDGKKIFFETSGDDPLKQNIKKILAERIDFILENELVIKYSALHDTDVKKLKSFACLSPKEIYAAFNNVDTRNAEVIKILNKFMESKKGQSFIKATLLKYSK